ncbi:MAG: VWA domain-containing protein [Pyrinomonadaceae bacterium]
MQRNQLSGLCLIILFFAFVTTGAAQTPTPRPSDDGDVIRVDSRLIVVPVSVTDAKGLPVAGLTGQDFRILEEGRAVTLEGVSAADKVPLEIAILFDVSASTDSMFRFQVDTAAKFLRGVMRAEDRASVFLISGRPVMISPRDTAERSAAALQTIAPTKGFTAFYDSVATATEYLKRNAPQASRRVILVISDGEDTNSDRIAKAIQDGYKKVNVNTIDSKSLYQLTVANRNSAAAAERLRVIKLLQDADTVFYSVNPAGSSYMLNKMSVFGQENMQRFADVTGGGAFLPKFRQVESKDAYQNANNVRQNSEMLDQIFSQLAAELRAQYLIQYYSESDFPLNKYVKLDVGLQNRPGLRLRSRQGYYVKN